MENGRTVRPLSSSRQPARFRTSRPCESLTGDLVRKALQQHWPEYLMEAAELGAFMLSACAFTVLLWHPASPVHQAIANPTLRRTLTGVAMGLTAIAIIYSPWGKRSGAHFNP